MKKKFDLEPLNSPATDIKAKKNVEGLTAETTVTILQNEFSFAQADSQQPFIGTTGIATCIGVTFYDPISQTGAIAHCDTKSAVSSLARVLSGFPSGHRLEVKIIGGRESDPESYAKAESIVAFLGNCPQVNVTGVHVCDQSHPRTIVMDTRSGRIIETEPPHDIIEASKRLFFTGFSKSMNSIQERSLVYINPAPGLDTQEMVQLSEKAIHFFNELKENPSDIDVLNRLRETGANLILPDEAIIAAVREFDEEAARRALAPLKQNFSAASPSPPREPPSWVERISSGEVRHVEQKKGKNALKEEEEEKRYERKRLIKAVAKFTEAPAHNSLRHPFTTSISKRLDSVMENGKTPHYLTEEQVKKFITSLQEKYPDVHFGGVDHMYNLLGEKKSK